MVEPTHPSAAARVAELRTALAPLANADRAPQMAAYMKDHFAYFGIKAAPRRQAQRTLVNALKSATGDELIEFALACWAEPEREIQYTGSDALRKHVALLDDGHLPALKTLIVSKSWWDTVDSLAVHTVGPVVARHPDLTATMDAWIDDENFWLARTAILYQLSYKERTDADRLFGYVDRRAADTEFFIRKALGWALRQYARTDPDGVRTFVTEREGQLSGLTKREALKHL